MQPAGRHWASLTSRSTPLRARQADATRCQAMRENTSKQPAPLPNFDAVIYDESDFIERHPSAVSQFMKYTGSDWIERHQSRPS